MALAIYTSADPSAVLSQDGDYTQPLLVQADGRTGGVIERRLYLRNDDPAFSYSGISMEVFDPNENSLVDGTNGFSWKLIEGDTQPMESAWDNISAGNTVDFSNELGDGDASDTATYLPFWVRVDIPRSASVQNITRLQVRTVATEILV